MAFRNWRIGMHIQQDHIAIVALLLERSRWALRRWWSTRLCPAPCGRASWWTLSRWPASCSPGGGSCLCSIRRVLPSRRARTLQKQLPRPQISLRESEQATWIASAMAQQLEMPASSLWRRLCGRQSGGMAGGSPPRSGLDINVLGQLASRLKLKVVGIVPDASALGAFFPWQPDDVQGLAWRDEASGFGPPR